MSELLSKLSRETQVVLGGTLLYLIFSFLDWQQISAFGISAGRSEWHGIGVVAGLCAIAVLLWEAIRVFQPATKLAGLEQGLVSAALVLALLLFTVITFFDHNVARHWPAWIGLVLSIVVALAALARAREEGVKLPAGTTPPDATAH